MARGVELVIIAGCLMEFVLGTDSAVHWYPYVAAQWANTVDKHNIVCLDGKAQSPIDFEACPNPIPRSEPDRNWPVQKADLLNNGHTIQLTAKGNGTDSITGSTTIFIAEVVKVYTLLQCHFHFGSEHAVGGKQFPFETHCVHVKVDSNEVAHYGVVGAFFDVGAASPFLQVIEDELPPHELSMDKRRRLSPVNVFGNPVDGSHRRLSTPNVSTFDSDVNFMQLFDGIDHTHYWNYMGSFTTPPCTEAVDFYIFTEHLTLSSAQLEKFKVAIGWQAMGGNFRPPQPIHGRDIYGCTTEAEKKQTLPWYPYEAAKWAASIGESSNPICQSGGLQSPINFQKCKVASSRDSMGITWVPQPVILLNNGHTVQLTANGAAPGDMTVGPSTYNLKQCHFHWASEHTVAGEQFPLEVHCVHFQPSDVGGTYGVFGMFYELGEENAFLKNFEDQLPEKPAHSGRRLLEELASSRLVGFDLFGNPMDNLKRKLSAVTVSAYTGDLDYKQLYAGVPINQFWDYLGSLTSPGCSEGVNFYIMMNHATLTQAQLTKFTKAIGWGDVGGNFRPPQPLGTRVVHGCDRILDEAAMVEEALSSLPPGLRDMVATTVRKEVEHVLEEKQGEHTGLLVTLVALVAFIFVVMILVLVALVVTLRKRSGLGA